MARPRLYRTPAVVLKRMDYGEADRLLTLYTRDHGKLRALAKGVRRTTSRSAGHLEPFMLADVLLARGRELDIVSQADTLASFRSVREDVEKTSYAYYMSELTDLMTADRLENVAVYEALADGLESLETQADSRYALVAFQMALFQTLGYRPELVECVTCRESIAPGDNQFSAQLGGVLCPTCGPREPSARPCGTAPLKLLRHVQRSPRSGQGLRVASAVSRQAEALLRDYAELLVERHLRAPALIARVQQASSQPGL